MNLIKLAESQLKFYHVSFSEEVRKGFLDETFSILKEKNYNLPF